MTAQKVIEWLLDPENAGVRYIAMRDPSEIRGNELEAARQMAHDGGPIARLRCA